MKIELRLRSPSYPAMFMLHSLVVALALATGLLSMPGVARATPINFTLMNGDATFGSGATITLTGSFTFDTAITTQSNVSLTVAGTPAFNGTYVAAAAINTGFTDTVIAKEPVSTDIINAIFSAALDGKTNPDPLKTVEFLTTVGTFISTSTSGAATVVPEPSDLAVFVTAAVSLWLLMRQISPRRRVSSSRPQEARSEA